MTDELITASPIIVQSQAQMHLGQPGLSGSVLNDIGHRQITAFRRNIAFGFAILSFNGVHFYCAILLLEFCF